MWYVVQVHAGNEENIRIQCERRVDDSVLESCFIPHYEEKRKVQGAWKVQQKRLFPGYVFLVSDDIMQLKTELKKVSGLAKLLGTGDEVIPLTEKEVDFIWQFGGEKHLVGMSEGIIIGDRTVITSGPLMGKEGLVRRIDRHKRKAWLELEMFGRLQKVEVGLEITEKIVAPVMENGM